MKDKYQISETWIKASIIGTIWAASEIVLGSFLHNLKVPFSSNILTGIGIVILISASYIWTGRGLFWRAGLICALMKTMSPSAVIFGPMIAIFSQALLLELSVTLLGKSMAGFVIGAILAMSWNLFQKILNYIIFYGFSIVEVYTNLLQYAQKQFDIRFDIVWLPILVLFVIYGINGVISAVIGIRVGRKLLDQPTLHDDSVYKRKVDIDFNRRTHHFNYSIVWLLVDLIFMVGALVLLNYTLWQVWAPLILLMVVIWVMRYKRALRQLSKPRFWVSFVIITMLTAFVFNQIQSGTLAGGLMIGLQMNVRAVMIILGFSVLGTELYNPAIRGFFMRSSFKQLPLALELSFESLPSMIANIPELKAILRNPVAVIHRIVLQAESRLDEIKKQLSRQVFIITGPVGSGKTTQILKVAELLVNGGVAVGGIFSSRLMDGDSTVGYHVVDLRTGENAPFLQLANDSDTNRIGRYTYLPEGVEWGNRMLDRDAGKVPVMVIDEVGKLELGGNGWADAVTRLVKEHNCCLVLSVRDTLVEQVIQKWGLENCTILSPGEWENPSAAERITTIVLAQLHTTAATTMN